MTERVIVAMIGRSRYEQYLVAPLTPEIIACDVCNVPSRPLFYVVAAKKFCCVDCIVPLPA